MNTPIDFRIVGSRIQKYRIEHKLTQDQLAELIDSTQAYISEIEAGKHRLFFDTVVAIVQVLNISVDNLIADFEDSSNASTLQVIQNDIQGLGAKHLELLQVQINMLKKINI